MSSKLFSCSESIKDKMILRVNIYKILRRFAQNETGSALARETTFTLPERSTCRLLE